MNYQAIYDRLFAPIEALLGKIDRDTIVSIIGFDMGGPVNLCTIGRGEPFVTYLTCELAVRQDQPPGQHGRYEFLMTCDDEDWCRAVLTGIARMSLTEVFNDHHTLDIRPWVGNECPIQAVFFENIARVNIDGASYSILRVVGISWPELEHARARGVEDLIVHLKSVSTYPRTGVHSPRSNLFCE